MIKFFDIKRQDQNRINEIIKNLKKNFRNTDFILGKNVFIFEKKFSKLCNAKYAISCANGTDALTIALKSLNLKKNSEVILPAMTYCSTLIAVLNANLKPVLVDISNNSSEIDISKIKKKINKKTKVILPVHLYGSPVNLHLLKKIIKNKKIYLIDDCAQAHAAFDFSSGKKKNIGSITDISCFSFYPGKNLGAYGDAGAIITNNDKLAEKMRMFANHGALRKHNHLINGINSRLDGIQAAILSVKLKYLNDWTDKRINNALFYNELLSNQKKIVTPIIHPNAKHVFHLYVLRVDDRNHVKEILRNNDISTGIHYPTPLPFMAAFSHLGHTYDDFPIAYDYMNKILSLPMYSELSEDKIRFIVKTLLKI